ncbi:hypothetical protein B7494_g2076 [Chlorociboria aeruginascens]|nr:hypothetical protein B7494_g2076 [Chlorociboria aeruginascens]
MANFVPHVPFGALANGIDIYHPDADYPDFSAEDQRDILALFPNTVFPDINTYPRPPIRRSIKENLYAKYKAVLEHRAQVQLTAVALNTNKDSKRTSYHACKRVRRAYETESPLDQVRSNQASVEKYVDSCVPFDLPRLLFERVGSWLEDMTPNRSIDRMIRANKRSFLEAFPPTFIKQNAKSFKVARCLLKDYAEDDNEHSARVRELLSNPTSAYTLQQKCARAIWKLVDGARADVHESDDDMAERHAQGDISQEELDAFDDYEAGACRDSDSESEDSSDDDDEAPKQLNVLHSKIFPNPPASPKSNSQLFPSPTFSLITRPTVSMAVASSVSVESFPEFIDATPSELESIASDIYKIQKARSIASDAAISPVKAKPEGVSVAGTEPIHNFRPLNQKPVIKFNFASALGEKLPGFLAKMEAANAKLDADRAAGKSSDYRFELSDEESVQTHGKQVIQMELGLGVLEEQEEMAELVLPNTSTI